MKWFLSWSCSFLFSVFVVAYFSVWVLFFPCMFLSSVVSSYVFFWPCFPPSSILWLIVCSASVQCITLLTLSFFSFQWFSFAPSSLPSPTFPRFRQLFSSFFFFFPPLSLFKNLIGMLSSSCLRKPYFFFFLSFQLLSWIAVTPVLLSWLQSHSSCGAEKHLKRKC